MGNPHSAAIRRATPRDAVALGKLENQVFSSDRISLRSFRRLLRRESAVILAAEQDDRVTGYAMVLFRRNSPVARLYSIAIAPRDTGRGLGRALLKAAEDTAIRRQSTSMRLEVREDNSAAIGLYRASGYLPAGRIPGYYADGCDALRLAKPLTATAGIPAATAGILTAMAAKGPRP